MSTTAVARRRFSTSVAKELVVGISGVMLVGFILMHLSGNLLLLLGPGPFNHYSERLHNLGEFLWTARIGLIVIFVVHISMAISLAKANLQARGGTRYEVDKTAGRKKFPTRMMTFSGGAILFFVLFHVYDFSISGDPAGPRSFVTGLGDESLGLYGVVFNAFGNPIRALLYMTAVCCVGMHLSHAIASVVVTLGFLADRHTGRAELAARVVGIVVAAGFSSIPLYVMFRTYVIGLGV
jgi:succinate dehydrogenase / fumarate reductase cytochrome b subunit